MSRRGKQPEVLPDWVKMQQKTFTRWFNKHLKKIGESITDLQEGLEDGLKVVKFVELVTGETIPKYNRRPRIRIQKIENLKIAIEKIQTSKKFEFTSIGPEDIVDKNLKLILGFVWTIIMKCSIEEISVEEMTAKEALLLWCKKQTQGYANVNVRNFTTSWKDGLAFAAIIHHNKPSAVDYNSLDPKNPADNLETAFEAANQLGIDRFLDVEDMLTEIPDEKAVMTYLAEYFQYFSSGQKQQNAARRIGKLMDFTKTNDELKADYETLGEELMKWIVDKTKDLQNHDFGNTKEEIEKLIDEFDDYKKNEKPPKVTDKSNLESLYNTIARKLEANNRPPFIPKGPTIENIQGKWEELENAEKERDRLLRDELARQERLEALLANFNNKVKKLKKFYQDKKNQLTSPHEVSTLIAANQELKQLDAYDDEYDRSKPRLEEVMVIGNKIINENYKDKDEIQNKMDELTGNWDELKDLAEKLRKKLEEDKKREELKEDLRKKWAKKAKNYNRWVKNTCDDVSVYEFGDTLEAVQKYKEPMDNNSQEAKKKSEKKLDKLKDIWKKMEDLDVKDNRYSAIKMENIEDFNKNLNDELAKRDEAYEKELQRQIEMDKKRKEFADAAEDFLKYLEKHVEEINSLTGEPEPLIEAIKGVHQEGNPSKEELEKVAKIDAEMKKMGIADNKYTKHTLPSLTAKRNKDVDVHVKDYISSLEEESKQKKYYEDEAKKWMKEVNDIIEKLKEREFDNTLEGAIAKDSEFIEYMSTQHPEKSAQKVGLLTLSDNINSYMKSLPYHRPEFEHPEGLSPKDLNDKWDELVDVENSRKEDIDNELTRQEKCHEIQTKFHEEAGKLEKWVDKQEKYLQTEEDVHTIHLAQTQMNKLENFKKDLDHSEKQIDKLKDMAKELKELNYHKIDEVEDRMDKLKEHWKSLFGLHDIKKKRLEDVLEKMDKKCKEFADAAEEFLKYLEKHVEEINSLTGEPEPLIEAIKEVYQEGNPSKEELAKVAAIDKELREMGIVDNKYTKHTLSSLTAKRNQDVDVYVKKYISAMEEESKQKKYYEDEAKKWMQEVNDIIEKLKEREFDNTLEGAIAKDSEFIEYMRTQHSEKSAQKVGLLTLSDNINSYMKLLPYNRPEFEHPEGLSPKDLNGKWDELIKIENSRKEDIANELSRQQKCHEIQTKFHEEAGKMEEWVDKQEKYLQTEEDVHTIHLAQTQMNKLENFKKDLDNSEKQIDKLKDMAKKLKELNYHKIDEVEDRMDKLKEHWKSLFGLHDIKKKRLEDVLEKMDKKCKEFADAAEEFLKYLEKHVEEINSLTGEPEPLIEAIKEVHQEGNPSKEELAKVEAIDKELREMGIVDNKYTTSSLSSLTAKRNQDVDVYVKKYISAMNEELRQKKYYGEQATKWMQEVNDIIEKLKEREFDNTLEGAIAKNSEFIEYMSTQHSEKSAQKVGLLTLSNNINGYMKLLPYNRPEFAHPEGLSPKDLNDKWDELIDVEEARKKDINTELTRQQNCHETQKKFHDEAGKLEKWVDKQEKYLQTEEDVHAIHLAQTQMNKLENFKKDLDHSEKQIDKLKDMAKKLKELNYHKIDEVEDRMNKLEEHWKSLFGLHDIKKKRLEDALDKMDKKRKEFADAAEEFLKYLEKHVEEINSLTGEPEPLIEAIKEVHQEGNPSKEELAKVAAIDKELREMGIADNKYTKHTLSSLTAKRNQDVDVYVKKYISAMEEELKEKNSYKEQATKWMQEVNDIIEKLKEREFDNTLEGAIAKNSEFIEYMSTQHSEKSAQKVGLLTLSNNINKYMKSLPYHRPEFAHPEGLSPKDLNEKWDELIKIEKSRKEDIANELSRQQKCDEIQKKFHDEAGKMEEWVDKQEKYLQTEEDVHTIHLAQTQMNKLENFKKDLDNSEKQIDKLKDMAKKLKELNYHKIDEVEDRMDKLKEHWKSLFGLHDTKKERLETSSERMDKKRKEFADAAEEFLKYLEKHVEEINALTGEPEPLIEAIKEVHQEGNPSKAELEKVAEIDAEMKKMGIADNKYTKHTLPSLSAKRNQDVDVYVEDYISAMKEELRQKKDYEEEAKKWMQEVNDIIEKLKEREFDNTLEGAIAKNSEFIEYKSTQHSEKSAQKLSLFNRSDNINGYMKSLPYHRPEFAHPEGLSPKDLDEKWKELLEVEEERKKDIDTELTRQEKCDDIKKKFHDEAGKLEKWVDKQEKYLKTEEDIHKFRAAQTQTNKLESFKKDLDHSEKQIKKLKERAKKLKELNYHKIDEVEDRMNKLEEHWKSLFGLHDIKKKRLEDALEKMDEKRKEFADAAEEFLKYLEKHVEEINALTGEPEPLIEAINEIYQEGNPSKEELAKVEAIDNELKDHGIADNKYTKHTLPSLSSQKKARC
ncbi:spectrin/filamin related cytoskeletal protein [Anaeramoeba ignava]|uniref:Spectrin/filamin related cytoskeletal protein n=1 Tax=Anaeramoeba ignava TaxID=1746090 RepID=A0A9Q0LL16_ANAIG|nr:spectrin/filamin related cytoskeletal protein [Anaeramoeba ignava]